MRAQANDFMQGFRYHVTATTAAGTDPLVVNRNAKGEHGVHAGFQSVTLPEISTEASEYREGTFKWTEKYPGVPVVAPMTLIRGIVKNDNAFYNAVMAALNGEEYRMDVTVYHFHRGDVGSADHIDMSNIDNDSVRQYRCYNAFGTRAKPAGDLDSMASEVSLAEIDLEMERFEPYAGPQSAVL